MDDILADLVQRELVAPRPERRFAGEEEFALSGLRSARGRRDERDIMSQGLGGRRR